MIYFMLQGRGLLFGVGIMMAVWLLVVALMLGWVCPSNAMTLLLVVWVGAFATLLSFRRSR